MRFYLGSGDTRWLGTAGVPLFYAYPHVAKVQQVPQAIAPWALDSGGFSELRRHGRWTFTEAEYIEGVRKLAQAGRMDFVCPMDWPCSPPTLEATGLTVRAHQDATVSNYLQLLQLAPDLPWSPVLQGWSVDDYHEHVDLYRSAGVDLTQLCRVTVGSVAGRQGDPVAGVVMRTLAARGLQLHGLGVKTLGLGKYAECMASADSHGWPMLAELNRAPLCDLPDPDHQLCKSCQRWAVIWHGRMQQLADDRIAEATAPTLFQLDDSHAGHEPVQRKPSANPFTPSAHKLQEQHALFDTTEGKPS